MTSERCGPRGFAAILQPVFRRSGADWCSASVPRLAPWAALLRRFAAGADIAVVAGLDVAFAAGGDLVCARIPFVVGAPCFVSAVVVGPLGFAVAGRRSASVPTWGVHGSCSGAASWPF